MIFVTVGTHYQGFERLISAVDKLIEKNKIKDTVIMQIGYSKYIPKNCKWFKFIEPDEFLKYCNNSDIIISHGGIGSIIPPLKFKKKLIIVPRLKKFNEHTNDHQLQITKELERQKKIIAIYDGEFSFLKLLITKKKKIISVIDLDVTPAYSKVLNVNFKDILDLKYNQIIMEVSFPVYGRTLTEKKYLFIVAYENGAYKQIFSHEIELEAIDSFDQWQQHIKYDYSITSGKNAKIVFTNTKNSLIDANNKKLEPPKIDKTEEYVWDGTEFKRVNWSIYRE